jgi:N-acetylmuramoyl-L-alanine amidase
MERVRDRRRRLYLVATAAVSAVAVGAIVLGVALASVNQDARPAPTDLDAGTLEMLNADEATPSADASDTAAVLIEVPDVTGASIEEAELLLGVTGFVVVRVSTPPGDVASGTVLAQTPPAGERVVVGSTIELVWADPTATVSHSSTPAGTPALATAAGERPRGRSPIVCIDPGHQARANTAQEPIGPGATETKAKVTGGGIGVVTKQAEYRLVLAISLKLKERLETRGITVVMTRSADAVDISNSQRAKVASDAGADLFVRIHADSSTNADLRGVWTLCPSRSAWVAPIEARSLTAARSIHSAVLVATGASDRGVVKRGDLSGFNWSTVPSVLVETGFLSNPVDDRALADPAYQDTIADGIAAGVFAYLGL